MKKPALKQFGCSRLSLKDGQRFLGEIAEVMVGGRIFLAVDGTQFFAAENVASIVAVKKVDRSHQERFQIILRTVAQHFHVDAAAVQSKTRTDTLCVPRHVVMLFCYENGFGQSETGRFFQRCHSSVSMGIQIINNRIKTEKALAESVAVLRARLEKALAYE